MTEEGTLLGERASLAGSCRQGWRHLLARGLLQGPPVGGQLFGSLCLGTVSTFVKARHGKGTGKSFDTLPEVGEPLFRLWVSQQEGFEIL